MSKELTFPEMMNESVSKHWENCSPSALVYVINGIVKAISMTLNQAMEESQRGENPQSVVTVDACGFIFKNQLILEGNNSSNFSPGFEISQDMLNLISPDFTHDLATAGEFRKMIKDERFVENARHLCANKIYDKTTGEWSHQESQASRGASLAGDLCEEFISHMFCTIIEIMSDVEQEGTHKFPISKFGTFKLEWKKGLPKVTFLPDRQFKLDIKNDALLDELTAL